MAARLRDGCAGVMGTLYAWVSIGCLECGNATYFNGTYATEDEARAAVRSQHDGFVEKIRASREQWGKHDPYEVQYPEPIILKAGEDPPEHGWHGGGVEVLLAIEVPA